MKFKSIFVFVLLGFGQHTTAQVSYVPSQVCCDITNQIMDLKVITAKKNIEEQLKKTPGNFYLYYLDQYAGFINLLVAPNQDKFNRFKDNYYAYRDIMDGKGEDSPYYYYLKSSMQLQMALAKLKFGDYVSGINLAFRSYRNTRRNTEKYPGFYGNDKMNGLFTLILSNIPPFIRGIARMFGVTPTGQSPVDLLKAYKQGVAGKKGLTAEADIFISLAYLLEKEPMKGYKHIAALAPEEYQVFLIKYFYGNLAYHARKNEEALEIFRSIDVSRMEIVFYPFYFLYGKILLNKLDPQAALYLHRFVDETNGIDYLKQSHLYLAYYYLMNGEREKYENELALAESEGSDKTERDRDAICDLNSGYIPDTLLLKASFLIKGGYFQEAGKKLAAFNFSKAKSVPDKLNFTFLSGNVALGLGDTATATGYFRKTVKLGKNKKYYFASNAALNLGIICESQGNPEKAVYYYELCTKFYNSGYYESIEDKAEKGLERIKSNKVE